MKTIYINGKFLSQSITGVQRTGFELVKALDRLVESNIIDRREYELILIHPYIPDVEKIIQLKHIRLLQRSKLKKGGFVYGNFWEQIELPLYTKGHFLISLCMVSTLFKKNQLVLIHDAACYVKPQYFTSAFRNWYRFAISRLGKVANKIATVSNYSKQQLNSYAGINSDKITVIYNAADHILRFADPSESFKEKVNQAKPYILAVSSLSPNKNFSGLSEALKKLTIPNINVLIAGGINTRTLQHTAVDHSATWLGYVSNEELKYLYQQATLFVFPSFFEGFGIPPVEAMICGCPVLSSNAAALPEVLGNGCVYCDPANVDDIAHKIESLLNDPEQLASLKISGIEQAQKYNWEASAQQLFNLTK